MNCLRCGTKFEGTQSFCTACAEKMQKPLEDSPYLHTKIVLPSRKPAPAPKRPEPKKEKKKRPLRWIFSTVFLTLLCIALLLQGGWYFGQWLKDESALRQLEAQRASLQQEVDLWQTHLGEAMQSNIDLQATIEQLEAELAQAQADLVDLHQKMQTISQQIVFIDEGKTDFHKQDCVKFRGNEFCVMIRDDAVSQGYAPCELCLP